MYWQILTLKHAKKQTVRKGLFVCSKESSVYSYANFAVPSVELKYKNSFPHFLIVKYKNKNFFKSGKGFPVIHRMNTEQ